MLSFNKGFLDAIGGANVRDGVIGSTKAGEKGDIRGYVAGGSATGEND